MALHALLRGILVVAVLGCRQPTTLAIQDLTLAVADTLVSATDTTLGRPTELTVDERGLLYVTDIGRNTLVVLDSSGALIRRIGRSGSGPGEFEGPRSVRVARDTIRLLDGGNGRIMVFATDGAPVRVSDASPATLSGAVVFAADGGGVVTLNGRDSALARRFDPAGANGAAVGQPVVPATATWDFRAIKQQIWDGGVPVEIRNGALPALAPDGSLWLLLQTEGVARKYSAADSLEVEVAFTEPEFASIRADFFARNRADSSEFRFQTLAYFAAARVVGADLWVLVRSPVEAGGLIVVLGADGQVRRRFRMPAAMGVRGFDLSPDRRTLYLLAYDDGVILRARLP